MYKAETVLGTCTRQRLCVGAHSLVVVTANLAAEPPEQCVGTDHMGPSSVGEHLSLNRTLSVLSAVTQQQLSCNSRGGSASRIVMCPCIWAQYV